MTLDELLGSLYGLFAGQDVLVVGSAPGPVPVRRKRELLVTVNGSIGMVPFERPDLHVMLASRVESRPDRPANRDMLDQHASRHAERALFITAQPNMAPKTMSLLGRRKFTCGDILWMMQKAREEFGHRVGVQGRVPLPAPEGSKHRASTAYLPPSTGFLAVMLAVAGEAEHIRLAGFSWEQGYGYVPRERWEMHAHRGHLAQDREVLESFLQRWPQRFSGSLVEGVAA